MGQEFAFPLLSFLDDLALLFVLRRAFRSLQAGRGVTLIVLGDLVASLGFRLVPLALLYVAPAVFAHVPLASFGKIYGYAVYAGGEESRTLRA
jgi:hypothetical protein